MTINALLSSARTLMQKSPKNIDIQSLTEEILGIDGVEDLHELHVWSIDSKINTASMHIKTIKKGVITPIKDILHSYNIHSSSIQRERGECPEPICQTDCENRKCCS
jgi:Co/Zn/Cd efflux system component